MAAVKCAYPVRIGGFSRLATRRDVQRLLIDCHVPTEDIRVEYDVDTLKPRSFWVDLPDTEVRDRALRWDGALMGGKSLSVVPVEPPEFRQAILNPLSMGSRGRYVLVSGVQENANLEDLVRFFEGFELMGNPVTVLKQSYSPSGARPRGTRAATGTLQALVRFMRTEEAHRAVRERQRGFLLNTPVTLRVLQ